MNQKVFYTTTPQSASKLLPMWQVLLCGAAILVLSMGIRHGFGLWLQPITQARGWGRQDFAFALAIQNLAWGGFGIFVGMLADRFGAARLMAGGAVVYALGLLGMAWATSPLMFVLSTGVMMGLAQAGTTFAIVFGVIGRNVPVEKRSWAMGVAAAAGSFGQFMMVPAEGLLIANLGWDQALVVLAGLGERAAAGRPRRRWWGTPAAYPLLLLPFCWTGFGIIGLGIGAAYAALSLGAAIEALRRQA